MPSVVQTFYGSIIQGMWVDWSNTYDASTALTAAVLHVEVTLNLLNANLSTFNSGAFANTASAGSPVSADYPFGMYLTILNTDETAL